MAADGKRCGVRLPAGRERVVVSAPICQNAIRRTMKALISTSRPIIFKWLLAVESNQSITDKILLKAALAVSVSLSHCISLLLFRFRRLRCDILLSTVLLSDIAAAVVLCFWSYTQMRTSELIRVHTYNSVLHNDKWKKYVNYFHIYTHIYCMCVREK